MNSIKPFFSMVNEDLDLKTMAPGLVGLYAFCQAINKVGNQSPYPVPTLDIISTEKVPEFKSNPVHFSFSKNSFKVYINPRLGKVNFDDGGGHDLMHALTTNIAKKFARERPEELLSRSAFKNSISGMTSKVNVNRVSPKAFKHLTKELAEFGIDYRQINSPEAVKGVSDVLQTISSKAIQRGKEDLPLHNRVEALRKAINKSIRTHFSPSAKVHPRGGSRSEEIENISKKKYEDEYGISGEDTLASNLGLPQYEAEENFGNTINNAIFGEVQFSQPINVEEALRKIQLALEESESELDGSLQNNLYAKLEKFLMAVFETYNTLLGKYGSVVSKNRQ